MNISLIAAISADGFIAESPHQSSLDWTSKEDTAFFVEKTTEIGAVVFGRTTFETIGKALKGRRTIVMTRGEKGKVEGVHYTAESPRELVKRLHEEGVRFLAVCGGAKIYSAFLEAGLITEFFLTVEPVLFGKGVPLFSEGKRVDLELVETRKLGESDSVLLHYIRS